jgi:alanyl-tRNA synthetase
VPHVHVVQGVPASSALRAGDLAKLAASSIGGGGGGRPDVAQGQGTDASKVDAAISALRAAIEAGLAKL